MLSINPTTGFIPPIGCQGQQNDNRAWWAFVQLIANSPYNEEQKDALLKNGLGSSFRASA